MTTPVTFFVLAEFTIFSAVEDKKLAPRFEVGKEFQTSDRYLLESKAKFIGFLVNDMAETAKAQFIEQLKTDRALSRAIGKTAWQACGDMDFKIFVSKSTYENYKDSADRATGPHDRQDFMREVILEIFDDNNNLDTSRTQEGSNC